MSRHTSDICTLYTETPGLGYAVAGARLSARRHIQPLAGPGCYSKDATFVYRTGQGQASIGVDICTCVYTYAMYRYIQIFRYRCAHTSSV